MLAVPSHSLKPAASWCDSALTAEDCDRHITRPAPRRPAVLAGLTLRVRTQRGMFGPLPATFDSQRIGSAPGADGARATADFVVTSVRSPGAAKASSIAARGGEEAGPDGRAEDPLDRQGCGERLRSGRCRSGLMNGRHFRRIYLRERPHPEGPEDGMRVPRLPKITSPAALPTFWTESGRGGPATARYRGVMSMLTSSDAQKAIVVEDVVIGIYLTTSLPSLLQAIRNPDYQADLVGDRQ